MASIVPSTTQRDAARIRWVREILGTPHVQLQRASTDAGFRSYWRTQERGPSRILMDSPPELEDVRPWLRIHRLLTDGGIRVPEVLACDTDSGFLLLEDLGGPTLAKILNEQNADMYFDAAIDQLLRLQAITPPADLGVFDETLLHRDAGLFETWFLCRHLGLELNDDDHFLLRHVQNELTANALAQPFVLTHRDFMPRNLMPVPDGPAVLDFQDCVRGPIGYDPISLFKDAFLSWPLPRVDAWLAHYHARATRSGLPLPPLPRFRQDADWLGIQRHLKILGIFSRLHYRDGKVGYLPDAPRFIAYLDEILPRYATLRPLAEWLDRRVKPAMRYVATNRIS
ncbi:MAG: phosphotransferase [Xanthomonadaceae bacterium]|jgi:aminoglycoside/choline kinase family phosphotransferase|nr:phosphotransferase [Xanthomonadaceae bacterium]